MSAASSNVSTNVYCTAKEFESLGISKSALEKINAPLTRCLHRYFKHVKYGPNEMKSGAGQANAKMIDPEKYYLAKAYMSVADSMLKLDEYNPRDQEMLKMYMDLLQRLEVLSKYSD